MRPHDVDIAVDATLRAAAVRAGRRRLALAVEQDDLRRRVREHRAPYDACIVVDNSYSLHADRLVEKVKGLVFALLEDAVGHGDRVSLVTFRSGSPEAVVALRPTASLQLAARRLRDVPLSGRTPLAHALLLTRRLLRQELTKRPNARPLAVVVTDGRPNVPLRPGADALADVLAQGRALRRAGIGCLVLDAAPGTGGSPPGCALALAEAVSGLHLPLADVAPGVFLDALGRIA